MAGRTYRYMSDPLFPFGFGLSYTTFMIGKASVSSTEVSSGESIKLAVPVSNTGKRDGTEIIQVYVRKADDSDGPLKTLRGFQRVDVAAGKTVEVSIDLPYSSFEFFDRSDVKMAVNPGEYEILYGNSSDARDLKKVNIMIR